MSYAGEPYAGAAYAGATAGGAAPPAPASTNVLLVTASTSHLAYTRSKAALESRGHTVTGSLDTTTALNAAWSAGSFAVIATVRINFGSAAATAAMGWMRDKWAAGTPLLIGGSEAGASNAEPSHFAKRLGVLGGAFTADTTALNAGRATTLRVTAAHPAVSGYAINAMVPVVSSNNYVVYNPSPNADCGIELGDIYVDPTDFGLTLSAVSAGQPLVAGVTNTLGQTTAPARAVFCGWLYAGQTDYTADGKIILGQAVDWLAGASPPVASSSMKWWDGAALQPATMAGWWDGAALQPVTMKWWDGTTEQPLS